MHYVTITQNFLQSKLVAHKGTIRL